MKYEDTLPKPTGTYIKQRGHMIAALFLLPKLSARRARERFCSRRCSRGTFHRCFALPPDGAQNLKLKQKIVYRTVGSHFRRSFVPRLFSPLAFAVRDLSFVALMCSGLQGARLPLALHPGGADGLRAQHRGQVRPPRAPRVGRPRAEGEALECCCEELTELVSDARCWCRFLLSVPEPFDPWLEDFLDSRPSDAVDWAILAHVCRLAEGRSRNHPAEVFVQRCLRSSAINH